MAHSNPESEIPPHQSALPKPHGKEAHAEKTHHPWHLHGGNRRRREHLFRALLGWEEIPLPDVGIDHGVRLSFRRPRYLPPLSSGFSQQKFALLADRWRRIVALCSPPEASGLPPLLAGCGETSDSEAVRRTLP